MRRPTRLILALMVTGFAGTLALEAYRDAQPNALALELSVIGRPFCLPPRGNPHSRTFFRLALAQSDSAPSRPRTEVGPFSNAIPDAASIARADANPTLVNNLGNLHFGISTANPLAQKFFNQGMTLAFGFNHLEALRAFRKARNLDPNCALCYWGEALVLGPNINAGMDAESVAPAFEAISRASALAAGANAKERALIEALRERYGTDAKADRAPRDARYAAAMQKVAARFPTDDHISALYAEALMDLQPWDYWEAAGSQPKGRTAEIMAVLERILQRNPDHPGAMHYYIHLTEASSDPARALPYARRLGDITPGAGHLVHMPFHTFFRVGLYKEAVEANRQAVIADEEYINRSAPIGIYPQAYYPHNVHSLMVSAQMAGDGRTVIESADKLNRVVTDEAARNISWVQPIKASPYFAHAQFSDPRTLLELADPGTAFPYVRAMWHYARAVGLAAAGRAGEAQAEADAIAQLTDTADFSDIEAGGVPVKTVLQLARHVIAGRIAQAARRHDEAVSHFQAAVKVEDTLPYNEPPYWYYPTRQSLGAAQVLAGDTTAAEATFRASLARAPNNGWALYGLTEVYKRRGESANLRVVTPQLRNAWMGEPEDLKLERL